MADLLAGCRAKLERAKENIDNLNAEITAFINSDSKPYKIVGELQDNGSKYAFVVRGDPTPPLRFAVLTGEIIHHLRSTLDHLVTALVLNNGETPTREHGFPVCVTPQAFENACNDGRIKGISRAARKFIRSVQPYTCPAPDDTIFHVLNEFNILDKHKLLVVVGSAMRVGEMIELGINKKLMPSPGKAIPIVTLGNAAPRIVTKDGDVVWELGLGPDSSHFEAKTDFVSQIAFAKCGRVRLQPVIPALANFREAVVHAVDGVAGEFK